MLTETTVSKLREMHLSVMVNALKDQLATPQFQSGAFEDRIGLMVDAEWNMQKNNHLNELIRQATFPDPGACMENMEHLPDRRLKQEDFLLFGTCNYIHERHNIILLGAIGSGKTYLALHFWNSCGEAVLCSKVYSAPGSTGGIPDYKRQRHDPLAHGTVQEIRITHY